MQLESLCTATKTRHSQINEITNILKRHSQINEIINKYFKKTNKAQTPLGWQGPQPPLPSQLVLQTNRALPVIRTPAYCTSSRPCPAACTMGSTHTHPALFISFAFFSLSEFIIPVMSSPLPLPPTPSLRVQAPWRQWPCQDCYNPRTGPT